VARSDAVNIRRRLAQANPAAYLPDLAMSLDNLSNRQADTGDRDPALTSITEAVEHYRRLAAAYLPNLAGSLNNLSNRQADTGDRDAALTSITEAVDIRRRLAAANPAAYLPDLAASLNNLADRLAEMHDLDRAEAAWRTALQAIRLPVARADLRAAWAARLGRTGPPTALERELQLAASEADSPRSSEETPDRTAVVLAMRAQRGPVTRPTAAVTRARPPSMGDRVDRGRAYRPGQRLHRRRHLARPTRCLDHQPRLVHLAGHPRCCRRTRRPVPNAT
jgi:tetratricopeptide (TPR) repeat protein